MSDDGTTRVANLERTERAQWRAVTLRADLIKVAEQVADNADSLAETMLRLASQHPYEAGRLRAKSEAAERHALRTRRLASDLQAHQPVAGDGLA